MRLNNKGFALTSIIYMLIVLFLMIMLLIMANLASRKVVLDKLKYDVKEKLNQGGITAPLKYIVTFDPNGGELTQTEKEVEYNEPYGELPTPTKEGYIFKGWNGKNMFELKENIDWKLGGECSTNLMENSITISGQNWALVELYLPILKKNTSYSISANIELINQEKTYIRIAKERNKTNGNTFILDTRPGSGFFSSEFSIGDSDETTAALALYGNTGYSYETELKISNIQLEEGEEATEYEPYYITSDTKVVQKKNHTLTAIWEPVIGS